MTVVQIQNSALKHYGFATLLLRPYCQAVATLYIDMYNVESRPTADFRRNMVLLLVRALDLQQPSEARSFKGRKSMAEHE